MRLIDADQAEKAIKEEANEEYCMENYSVFNGLKIAQQLVKDAETIDAVPVVRCKYCVYEMRCVIQDFFDSSNGFCSIGERKIDDKKR